MEIKHVCDSSGNLEREKLLILRMRKGMGGSDYW